MPHDIHLFVLQRRGDRLPEDFHGLLVAVDEIEDLRNGGQSPGAGVEQVGSFIGQYFFTTKPDYNVAVVAPCYLPDDTVT